jgi:hypothetical protein
MSWRLPVKAGDLVMWKYYEGTVEREMMGVIISDHTPASRAIASTLKNVCWFNQQKGVSPIEQGCLEVISESR